MLCQLYLILINYRKHTFKQFIFIKSYLNIKMGIRFFGTPWIDINNDNIHRNMRWQIATLPSGTSRPLCLPLHCLNSIIIATFLGVCGSTFTVVLVGIHEPITTHFVGCASPNNYCYVIMCMLCCSVSITYQLSTPRTVKSRVLYRGRREEL